MTLISPTERFSASTVNKKVRMVNSLPEIVIVENKNTDTDLEKKVRLDEKNDPHIGRRQVFCVKC